MMSIWYRPESKNEAVACVFPIWCARAGRAAVASAASRIRSVARFITDHYGPRPPPDWRGRRGDGGGTEEGRRRDGGGTEGGRRGDGGGTEVPPSPLRPSSVPIPSMVQRAKEIHRASRCRSPPI